MNPIRAVSRYCGGGARLFPVFGVRMAVPPPVVQVRKTFPGKVAQRFSLRFPTDRCVSGAEH